MSIKGVRLLVLCHDRDQFEFVESYLAHKGVNTHICLTVEAFSKKLLDFDPDYALIAIDHKDGYVRKLFGALQGSKVKCIPTAEVNDAISNRMLDEIDIETVLYPPISGTRTEHLINYLESQKRKLVDRDAETIDYSGAELSNRINEFMISYKAQPTNVSSLTEIELLEKELIGENSVEQPGDTSEVATGLMDDLWHLFDETMHSVPNCKSVDHPKELSDMENLIVYSIKGGDVMGYAVAAITSSTAGYASNEYKEVENQFLLGLSKVINGPMDLHKIELKFEPFDYLSWIISEGGVLQSFVIGEQSLSWGFIQRPDMDLVLKASDRSDMVGVDIDEISSEVKTRNDLYLHFPKNNKFLLHTKKGHLVEDFRVSKLKSHKVEEIHIKMNDVDDFKSYQVEKDIAGMVKKHKKTG